LYTSQSNRPPYLHHVSAARRAATALALTPYTACRLPAMYRAPKSLLSPSMRVCNAREVRISTAHGSSTLFPSPVPQHRRWRNAGPIDNSKSALPAGKSKSKGGANRARQCQHGQPATRHHGEPSYLVPQGTGDAVQCEAEAEAVSAHVSHTAMLGLVTR